MRRFLALVAMLFCQSLWAFAQGTDDDSSTEEPMNPEDCTALKRQSVCDDEGCREQLFCNGQYIGDAKEDEAETADAEKEPEQEVRGQRRRSSGKESPEETRATTGNDESGEAKAEGGGDNDGEEGKQSSGPRASKSKATPPGPIAFTDAKENIGTVVEIYIRKRSPDGYFVLKDMSGKVWNLELDKIDETTTKRLKNNVFAVCGQFHSLKGREHALDVDFSVDFGAGPWKVSEVRIHRVDGHARFLYDRHGRRISPSGKPLMGDGSTPAPSRGKTAPPPDAED